MPFGLADRPRFTACAPGIYGADCSGVCACGPEQDCNDGVGGDGRCTSRVVDDDSSAVGLFAFENATLRRLRVDHDRRRTVRQVKNASVSRVRPTAWVGTPRVLATNAQTARLLRLPAGAAGLPEFAAVLSGARVPRGATPYAHAYAGHQFGNWAGQLGDGRSISLGELRGGDARNSSEFAWEVALKGSGRTPYSRGGDGRAVLQNACRELLGDAALVAIGVPAARSLAVLGSDDDADAVTRDEWYTGRPQKRRAGIVVRVAPTFLRFGSVQLAAKRQGHAGVVVVARHALRILADVEATDDAAAAVVDGAAPLLPDATRERCFFARRAAPSCAAAAAAAADDREVLRCLLERAAARTGALIAAWAAAGFAHGVLNTDNLSLLGLTLDLNVYGFLSAYDPSWAPNHIDDEARYAFGKQRSIGRWNLERLADALTGTRFVTDTEADAATWMEADEASWLGADVAAAALGAYDDSYEACYDARMRLRLGLTSRVKRIRVQRLVDGWHAYLRASGADYHVAARGLAEVQWPLPGGDGEACDAADDAAVDGAWAEEAARRLGAAADGRAADVGTLARWLRELWGALNDDAARAATPIGAHVAAWRRGLRARLPVAVARSDVLREVTEAAAEGGRDELLRAALAVLQRPFEPEAIELRAPTTAAGWGRPSPWPGADATADELERVVRARLSAPTPASARGLTTSCGGQ